tara:strand:- start:106406 stop:106708 length:303 start_codon:yes stop_codon:yes gene_type:complete
LKQLSKVILSSADFEWPGVIGLCETENRFVFEKLLAATPIKGHAYAIVHKDSTDDRSIRYESFYVATSGPLGPFEVRNNNFQVLVTVQARATTRLVAFSH